MTNETKSFYYLFKEGAVQEEPWEWSNLEEMCREGRLSPDSLIFMPDENEWRRAVDTELAPLFRQLQEAEGELVDDEAASERIADAYQRALEQIEQAPGLLVALLNAGEIAVTMGNVDAGREHYQNALNRHPYHPRAVQEAKKNLPASEWSQLRYLYKPPAIWGHVDRVFSYPLSRGPLYLVIPTVVLSALWWIPGMDALGVALLYLWGAQVVRSSAMLEDRPPLWHYLLSESREALGRPALAGFVVAAELYLPFLVIAQIVVSSGGSIYHDPFTVIRTSPFAIVLATTLSLVYLPAVTILATSPIVKVTRVFNPLQVLKMIGRMDKEYMAAVGYIILMFCLWGMINLLLVKIPVAGGIVATLLGVYVMITSGLVLGRLQARFKEQMTD
ncbi:MAG: tol-pal system YbgF family protein [Candidatus Krumholzibacteriia bacterium]